MIPRGAVETRGITLFWLLALIGVDAWPAPIITNVSGVVAHGEVLTITGTELQQERLLGGVQFFIDNPTAWNFSGTDAPSDGYTNTTGIEPDPFYTTEESIIGSNSIKCRATGESLEPCPDGNLFSWFGFGAYSNGLDYWMRYYLKYQVPGGKWPNGLWPFTYIKNILVKAVGGGSQLFFQFTGGRGSSFDELPYEFTHTWGAEPKEPFLLPNHFIDQRLPVDRWMAIEHYVKADSPYQVTTWIDGVVLGTTTGATPPAAGTISVGIVNLCSTDPANDVRDYRDGLFMSTAGRIYPSSLVEIGSSADYATATKFPAEMLKISDTELQILLDLNTIPVGPTPYLWVTNNEQERSAAYDLGNGGSPILAPTGVNITVTPR